MKRLFASLMLALALAAASPASAAVQEFGSETGRFTIDVPAGWKAVKMDNGVQVSSPSEDTSVSIIMSMTTFTDAGALARNLAGECGFTNPAIEKEDEGTYSISGMVDGQEIHMVVVLDEGRMGVITFAGKDLATVEKIIDSITDKE